MEQIRFYCSELGWKRDNPEEIFRQQDVNEFYMFLLEKLNGVQIKIQSETITEAMTSPDDIGKETDIPYIPLALPTDLSIKDIKLKDMLDSWLSDNIKEVKRKIKNDYGQIEEKMVSALDVKHITNIPPIIPVGINRFQNTRDENGTFKLIRNRTHIWIQSKISPFKNNNCLNRREWDFHSAICHRGETPNSGHYYALIRDANDCYYIFDDLKTPCMQRVEMDDRSVTDLIKDECVFIIYKHKL
jgi:ubiquitin C-terminal hydrolase